MTVPTRTEARYINGTFHITSTLIDHIYCSSERNVASIHIPPLSLSDHFPVFLVRRANAASRQMGNKPSIIQYRSLSNLNEVNFRNDLRSAPWSLKHMMTLPMHSHSVIKSFKVSLIDMYLCGRRKLSLYSFQSG